MPPDFERLQEARSSVSRSSGLSEFTKGWQECRINRQRFFQGLAPLRLREGYQLRCFVSASYGDAVSYLYAVPGTLSKAPCAPSKAPSLSREEMLSAPGPDHPEYVWHLADDTDEDNYRRPFPPGALDHFMLAVEGDDTPYSYLLASLLGRDWEELFAQWHGVRWSAHKLLLASPFWSFERAYPLACEIIEAYQSSSLRDALLSILKSHAKEISWEDGLEKGLAEICHTRPAFLSGLVGDYEFCLQMQNVDTARAAGITGPLKEEDYETPIPPSWREVHSIPPNPPSKWTWTHGPIEDWLPTVSLRDERVEVQFLTYAQRDDAIVRHTDRFRRGEYFPVRQSEVLGRGGGGFMV